MQETKIVSKSKLTLASAKKNAPALHYVTKIVCSNCLSKTILTIPKGVTVLEYACKTLCTNCGCTIVEDLLGE
jgi:hypothetical protein